MLVSFGFLCWVVAGLCRLYINSVEIFLVSLIYTDVFDMKENFGIYYGSVIYGQKYQVVKDERIGLW